MYIQPLKTFLFLISLIFKQKQVSENKFIQITIPEVSLAYH